MQFDFSTLYLKIYHNKIINITNLRYLFAGFFIIVIIFKTIYGPCN